MNPFVLGMSDPEIMGYLQKFSHLLRVNNVFIDLFRYCMWWIDYSLGSLLSGMSKIFFGMYDLLNIWDSPQIKAFVDPYRPLFYSLATAGLVWAGIQIMRNKKVDYAEKMNNFVLAIVMFLGISFFVSQLGSLVQTTVGTIQQTSNPVVQIYQGDITDLMTVDKNGWKSAKEPQNSIKTMEDVRYIGADGISDVLSSGTLGFGRTKGLSDTGAAFIGKRIRTINGEKTLDDMTGVFNKHKYYYQYMWHPWLMLIEILTMFCVYGLSSVKVVILILELNVLGIITQGVALTGIDKSDRNRKLLTRIRDTAVVLVLQALLLALYSMFVSLSAGVISSQVGKLFAQIGGAMFAVMGPNMIGELFGIRSEVGSIGGTLMGLSMGGSALAKGAKSMGSTIKSTTQSAARKVSQTGSTLSGAVSGFTKKPSMPAVGDRIKEEIGKGNMPELAQEIGEKAGIYENMNQKTGTPGNTGASYQATGSDNQGQGIPAMGETDGIASPMPASSFSGSPENAADSPEIDSAVGEQYDGTSSSGDQPISVTAAKQRLGIVTPPMMPFVKNKQPFDNVGQRPTPAINLNQNKLGAVANMSGGNSQTGGIAVGSTGTASSGIPGVTLSQPNSVGASPAVSAIGNSSQPLELPVNTATIPLMATQSRQILNMDMQGQLEQNIANTSTNTVGQGVLGTYSNVAGRIASTPTVQKAQRKFSIAQRTTSNLRK